MDWLSYLALISVGFVAGTLNIVAAGGSFLTLPLLIFMGQSPTLANGTNRVAILVQNIGAVSSFHRYKLLQRSTLISTIVPALVGAGVGTLVALWIPGAAFKKILAALMVTASFGAILLPADNPNSQDRVNPRLPWSAYLAFFGIGFYGGFIQAGVGFLVLATTSSVGIDLVQGNALKAVNVLLYTVVSLGLFAWQGQVAWDVGLILGVGNFLGGLLGVHLTVLKGHRWVKVVVTIAAVALAIKLWISG